MRLLSKLAAIAIVILGAAQMSHAQAVNPLLPTTGTREISLRGNIDFEPDSFYSVDAGYGPFLNPNLQIAGTLGFTGGSGLNDVWTLGAEANYHFPGQSAMLPFVGAFLGYANGNGGLGDLFSFGLQGGVKYFMNPTTAFTAALVYRDFDKKGVDSQFGLNFGLAIFLR